ncbi:MAG: hypothetical protein ACK5HT_12195 [Draconibacterium sp.]
MDKQNVTRRNLIGKTAVGLAGLSVSSSALSMNAASYKRIIGSNDRIHTGFWHSIASIMATQAYRESKKLYWDRTKEVIVDHPVIVK